MVPMETQMRKKGEVARCLLQFCFEEPHLARLRRTHLLWLLGLRRTSVLRWNNYLIDIILICKHNRKRSARAAFGALASLLPISRLAFLVSHSPQLDHTGDSSGLNLGDYIEWTRLIVLTQYG